MADNQTLANMLRQKLQSAVDFPTTVVRNLTDPQAFLKSFGYTPNQQLSGFSAGYSGVPAKPPSDIGVLDPNNIQYGKGYESGEEAGLVTGILGGTAALAKPIAKPVARAIGQEAWNRTEKMMQQQGFMPSIVPRNNLNINSNPLKIAQQNATLPLSEGGLGLPKNNTAMDRAKAMGFDTPAYHGTQTSFSNFNPALANSKSNTGTPFGSVVVSSNPKTASTYAEKPYFNNKLQEWITDYPEQANIMPLLIKKDKNFIFNATENSPNYTPNWNEISNLNYPNIQTTNEFATFAKNKNAKTATIKNVKDNATISSAEGDTTFIFDPSLIRSRFAAFDPKRVSEANILAGGLAIPTSELTRKEIIEQQFNKK